MLITVKKQECYNSLKGRDIGCRSGHLMASSTLNIVSLCCLLCLLFLWKHFKCVAALACLLEFPSSYLETINGITSGWELNFLTDIEFIFNCIQIEEVVERNWFEVEFYANYWRLFFIRRGSVLFLATYVKIQDRILLF